MPMHRRAALRNLVAMFGAAPWLGAADDPLLDPANVLDFAPLARAKLDPMAWDYLDGGGEDEASLRDNRAAFQRIILRPRALVDVHKIDLSLELLGQKLEYPILLDPAGGKNCFHADGEHVVAREIGIEAPANAIGNRLREIQPQDFSADSAIGKGLQFVIHDCPPQNPSARPPGRGSLAPRRTPRSRSN